MTSYIKTVLLAFISLFFAFSLMIFPKQAIDASIHGLTIWAEIVFPSLLPFFILSELMIGFGTVQFIGVLLEPMMRPLFRVPGAGGFVWVLGMASGYPAGAKMAAQLREKKIITKIEAERLVSFTNASSPLFIFGVIAIGFFNNIVIGILLAISHYLSNFCVGICMRFYGKERKKPQLKQPTNDNRLFKAFKQMHRTRLKESRPFGLVLSDAVISSIKTLIMIGGFIILFSVITNMFQLFKINIIIAKLIKPIFTIFSIPNELTNPFVMGLFEITLGIDAISSYSHTSLLTQLIIISFILGLNGLSVQAQVASVISHTDIRFLPYFFARFLHGIFASFITFLLFTIFFTHVRTTTTSRFTTDKFNNITNLYFQIIHLTPYITIISLLLVTILFIKRLQDND